MAFFRRAGVSPAISLQGRRDACPTGVRKVIITAAGGGSEGRFLTKPPTFWLHEGGPPGENLVNRAGRSSSSSRRKATAPPFARRQKAFTFTLPAFSGTDVSQEIRSMTLSRSRLYPIALAALLAVGLA